MEVVSERSYSHALVFTFLLFFFLAILCIDTRCKEDLGAVYRCRNRTRQILEQGKDVANEYVLAGISFHV